MSLIKLENTWMKKERRAEDRNGEDGYKNRRFFNNGTIYKMLAAMILGGGVTGTGISLAPGTAADHDKILSLESKVSYQEKVFEAKLETINAEIRAVDGKLDIVLERISEIHNN